MKPDLSGFTGFDWDQGNFLKSEKKHGITAEEAEQIFLDSDIFYQEDIRHSEKERRFIVIGKIESGKILVAVFTPRHDKINKAFLRIRILSVRRANKKEIKTYEKIENYTKI